MPNTSSMIGIYYEQIAANYLKQQGLQCLVRNYRCRCGEIDWIGLDRNTLVFVEIKYRRAKALVSPIESIDHVKQQKLLRTAEYYLQQCKSSDKLCCRFDVVLIQGAVRPHIEWIQDAWIIN